MAIITSIQSGTISATSTSNTAAITSVDTSKSIVLHNGVVDPNTGAVDLEENFFRLDLQNATTVRARRDTDGGFSPTVYFTVIEFDELIDTIQTGEISLNSETSDTATITSVDTSLSAVLHQGQQSSEPSNDYNQAQVRVELTDATTVTARMGDTVGNTNIVNFVVVEFVAAAIENIQQGTVSVANASTTDTATITAVTMTNTILFDGGAEFSGSTTDNASDALSRMYINSTTSVETRRIDNEGLLERNFTAVEFVDGILEGVDREAFFISGSTSDTSSFAAVDLDFAAFNFLGADCYGTTLEYDEHSVGAAITSTTVATAYVDQTPTNSITARAEIWEFVDGAMPGGGGGWTGKVIGVTNPDPIIDVSAANIANVTGVT